MDLLATLGYLHVRWIEPRIRDGETMIERPFPCTSEPTSELPAAVASSPPCENGALALIAAFGKALTKRQRCILRVMRDENKELLVSGGGFRVGYTRISSGTFYALLRACAISERDNCYYAINETGKKLLAQETPAGVPPQANPKV